MKEVANPQTPHNVHGRTPQHQVRYVLLNRIPTKRKATKETTAINGKKHFSRFAGGGENRAPRSYHLTGGESYYGRKMKCKGVLKFFLQTFDKVSLHNTFASLPESEITLPVDSTGPNIRDFVQER